MNGTSASVREEQDRIFEQIQSRLAYLEERKREYRDAGKRGKEYLRFLLGDRRFAVELGHVTLITRKFLAAPLFHTPDHLAGIFANQGDVLSLFHLDAILGLPRAERKVMMVIGDKELRVGALVDDVAGIGVQTEEGGEPPSGAGPRFADREINFEDGAAFLLDVPALLKSEYVQL